ncbi:ATP-binding protein [Pseudonocardia broussonetiae]|uniref:AAA family ATPase n=1 Tax=Pseudonocardia broussonetiae TaxID=2736640 RepID=A0A6M6JJD1_9PSEU|nr:AAA family ATPase [Pseudonocardia broussonetiae]QJY48168.1 AAA family ATPase [Pseudonocardia broussonetiae]
MQPIARIRVLGRFDLSLGGVRVPPLESARAESLLAFLLLHRGTATPRQHLAFVLWPDSTEAQARTNLRHLLHTLRHRLPDADRYLEVTSRTVGWRADAPCWLDVSAFEDLLDARGDGRPEAVRDAVALYTGDLLEGCYDDWLHDERERLRQRQLGALGELATACEARGDLDDAVGHAERLLRGDPLREETHRQLMRCHEARGDRARAVRAYHVCCSTLERELGVRPSAETDAVYRRLVRHPLEPAPAARAGPPLVGRAHEQAQLAAAWRSTDAGQVRLVLVSGEAGVGKSRLVEEFRAWCRRRGAAVADARCYPAEGSLAYAPVVTWLRSAALRTRLPRLDTGRLTELARLVPELLVEVPDVPPPAPLPEGDQRRRLFDAVAAVVLAGGGPLLLVVDDLQHVDRETCRLLHYLLRVQPDARLLVVATARREDVEADQPVHELLAGARARECLAEIALGRLGRDETAVLAERALGARLSRSDVQHLYDETEGNPLFVVEALRAGWTPDSSLSPRVQSVIDARLAQLSVPARDLAGLAAAIGREFSADVLAAAADADEDTVVGGLDELWRRQIVRERSEGAAGGTYDFSHDKIRQVAYLHVSPARRRRLHARIAAALERTHLSDPGPVSVQIAVHLDRSGAVAPAVEWYCRAARAAQLLHAGAQAVRLLDRGLELLLDLPGSPDRDARELDVRTALLAPLVSVGTYASSAMSENQHRALTLARVLGVEPAPPLLRSLAVSALTRSEFAQAEDFGRRLRRAADRDGDDVLVVEAAYVTGIAAFWQADLETARPQFELAVERYRARDHTTHVIRYAHDPKVVCLSRLANTLWFLGLPDDARTARAAALDWATAVGHRFSRTIALTFGALLALDMGDERELREHVAELSVVGHEAVTRHVATAFTGYVAVLDGDTDDGRAAIRAAVEHTRGGGGAPGQHAIMLRLLLAAHLAARDTVAALDVADRLLATGGTARLWAPHARRVRTDLARGTGPA